MHRLQRRQGRTPYNWIRCLLTLALVIAFTTPALAASGDSAILPCAEVARNAAGWPVTLRGCTVEASDPESSAEDQAGAFLGKHHSALGLEAGLANLRVSSVRHGLDSSHVVYQQTLADYPVFDIYLSVHFGRTGQIQVIHNRTLPQLRLENAVASISAVEAVRLGRDGIQFTAPRASSPAPELVVLPIGDTLGRLAWRVNISAAQPQGDWEVLVDATSGQVIKRYNRLVMARGQVFDTAPEQQDRPGQDDAAPSLRTLPLLGLDESGWLRGEYVDVTQPEGYQPAAAFSLNGDFLYAPDDPRFKEVMVYHYIDSTQRYLQTLGYSDDNAPPNGIRERVTYASPHWFNQDQSFYSVSDDALHFGDGGWADALDPDIIVHEYGHALLHDMAPHWGDGEMEAIGEGFGDYLAASRFARASADPACIGEWDSRAYVADPPYCLRRVDRDRQYPTGLSGDPHTDGEIWSRVLWDVRSAIGQQAADRLALESIFFLPPAASLVEAGQALLDADGSVFAGRYREVIEQALQARGLAPLSAPRLVLPAGGEVLTPGSLWVIDWEDEQAPGALPLDYEVAWSPNIAAAGVRQFDFNSGALADSFVDQGSVPWQAIDGEARSGSIEHGQHSSLLLPVETTASGLLSFRYRVDSEPGYDRLQFLIDGQVALEASGLQDWTTWSTTLPAGQHELVWRYVKDRTWSAGEDAVWIDDVRIEQASLAEWRPAELAGQRPANGDVLWRVPGGASATAGLRVRARLGDVASPWATSARLTIDAPTAVSLVNFQAGVGPMLASHVPLLPWGVAALLGSLAAGAVLGLLVTRRRL